MLNIEFYALFSINKISTLSLSIASKLKLKFLLPFFAKDQQFGRRENRENKNESTHSRSDKLICRSHKRTKVKVLRWRLRCWENRITYPICNIQFLSLLVIDFIRVVFACEHAARAFFLSRVFLSFSLSILSHFLFFWQNHPKGSSVNGPIIKWSS